MSGNFREFSHFYHCFVIRKFFHAMKVKDISFVKFLYFFHALNWAIFFLAKVYFCKSFYLIKYTNGLWQKLLLSYDHYNSLLIGTTVVKSRKKKEQKKVYRDCWLKPASVYIWIHGFLKRRKGMILSQNKCGLITLKLPTFWGLHHLDTL